ncbi:TIGR03086 family protein [Herbidospora sp. NEAU-GS84]|uniref:TIGR03086 family protein n=1 Tax=Herbidospora solisilvae TaxID=2696284 RepID=A0A7C9NI35_9ACTN|nr:TIGR03086 family metal-binding protein [Herbidospora solisilvae]NAS23578.1 TIGR03086 family protein [Herbidospora solisilvae]
MNAREVLATSFLALENTVAGVRDDQWDAATPCSEWTVAQVVQHAAADQLVWAGALGVGPGPAYDPFSPSGTIDGTAAELVKNAVEVGRAAWATVPDDAATVPTPLPHGELPTSVAMVMCALDAAVHAWDVAVATGQSSPLGEELAGHLLAAARQIVEPLRQWGAYAPVVEAAGDPSGTPVADELLRYLGRTPA